MTVPGAAPARVTLFLITEKGYRVLQHIVAHLNKTVVALVVGGPDEHLANGYFAEIQALCAPENISFQRRVVGRPAAAPYALAVSWRWPITGVDKNIILHDSLLPRYRGFASLVSCLLSGEPRIGLTAPYATA